MIPFRLRGGTTTTMSLLTTFLLVLQLLGSSSMTGTMAAKTTKPPTPILEPRTGIAFEPKIARSPLVKLGLRIKGPIKVYVVGQYGKHIFVLKMIYNVNAEKLSGALMDALKPRCQALGCDDNQANAFKAFVMQALPNGAKSGTTLVFNTAGGKVTLEVNGKKVAGTKPIVGKALAKAFAAIYTDDNAVCNMKPVKVEGGDDDDEEGMDAEMITTLGIMAATTLVLILLFTKPDTTTRIRELNLYPVKSCAEQTVSSAAVTPRGLQGDRIAMVVDQNGKCCTSRDTDKVKLFHVHPDVDVDASTLTLTADAAFYPLQVDLQKSAPTEKVTHNEAPDNLQLADYGNVAASWLETATGIPGCRLTGIGDDYQRNVMVNQDQGDPVPIDNAPVSLADEAPLLLTNEASLEDLNRRLQERGKQPVDMRRFRPNIVVRGNMLQPWEEDTWKKIRIIGSNKNHVEFFVWQRCGRCIMTTIDRDSLERSAEPLATLNTFRQGAHGQRNFGMHLVPDPATLSDDDDDDDGGAPSSALISLGDEIEVLEYDEERRKEWKENFGSL